MLLGRHWRFQRGDFQVDPKLTELHIPSGLGMPWDCPGRAEKLLGRGRITDGSLLELRPEKWMDGWDADPFQLDFSWSGLKKES